MSLRISGATPTRIQVLAKWGQLTHVVHCPRYKTRYEPQYVSKEN